MKNISKLKVWRKGEYKGEFLYFSRIGLTVFRDSNGNIHKPRLSFFELYRLYTDSEEHEVKSQFDPVTKLELTGKIVL